MRGGDERPGSLFSYLDLEARVPKSHPLRVIRGVANEVLAALGGGVFSALCANRPVIDRAGEASARHAAASLLLNALKEKGLSVRDDDLIDLRRERR